MPMPYITPSMISDGFRIWVCFLLGFSLLTGVIFVAHVIWKDKCNTTLMKQVVCLAIIDFSICLWELTVCFSTLHNNKENSVPCINIGGCNFLFPVLRTLQTSSLLCCLQIAMGLAFASRGAWPSKLLSVSVIPPSAIALNSLYWLLGVGDKYLDKTDMGWCTLDAPEKADVVFAIETIVIMAGTLLCYAYTLKRISSWSNAAVLRRTMHRAAAYIGILFICYGPYAIVQGVLVDRKRWEHKSAWWYECIYSLYYMNGTFNVITYGIHNWKGSPRLTQFPRGVRLLMFSPGADVCQSSISSVRESLPSSIETRTEGEDIDVAHAVPRPPTPEISDYMDEFTYTRQA
eukprot:TRINITY_DN63057_c0_g1_i1.p1 TRINITY_DN63057_c0_g1~~TRINITY_DN63057_c0_g1_i1.p1  ORF type:complete len:346 (+),score=3.34 TRINITY_DN63057_c0_g1_i1:79-1116(+)